MAVDSKSNVNSAENNIKSDAINAGELAEKSNGDGEIIFLVFFPLIFPSESLFFIMLISLLFLVFILHSS